LTGEKNRYKTHEQLWKLDDHELSTPVHDELVLQLLNKKNALKLFKLCIYGDFWYLHEDALDLIAEDPVCNDNKYIIGYVDVMIICPGERKAICVEVKPMIKSFGETLRQINTYKKYRSTNYVIYSPDTRFKTAFESQGVKFITPSDLGIK
jgi:hypothetical protein